MNVRVQQPIRAQHSLVLHLVDVELQRHAVLHQHAGNLEPVCIRALVTERERQND